ncbi:MAG: hypothetical protein H8E41_00595 [Desulfobulbaceae bacterium]|uniref:Uncharacterized protein n=1 Tax=Candidatus Desulfobia pelagia TaxID=2841692 RepID=A0A8J6TEQ9_9BACT|nr:hypothetical protein [Candidatus Desulfobia pelagia]
MIIQIIGILFVVFGTVVSLGFWIPGLIDRNRLREIMGSRFPMIYFIYFTNGPFLLLLGFILLTFFRQPSG